MFKQPNIIRKLVGLSFLATISLSPLSQAADLIDAYQLAKKNDPTWSSKEARYKAELETKNLGRAGLLPKVTGTVATGRTKSKTTADAGNCDLFQNAQEQLGEFIVPDGNGNLILQLPGEDTYATLDAIFNDVIANTDFSCLNPTDVSYTNTTIRLGVLQPLFRLDRWYDYKIAKSAATKAEIEYQKATQDLLLKTSETYFNVLKAEEEYNATKGETEALEYRLKITRRRFSQGLTNSLEVYEAQAIYDLSVATLVAVEAVRDSMMEDLSRLTGLQDIEASPLPESIKIMPPEPADPKKWVAIATRYNSEIQLAEIATIIAQTNREKSFAAHAPTVDLLASYQISDNSASSSLGSPGGEITNSAIGITMNFPLYAGGGIKSARDQAGYRLVETRSLRDAAVQEVGANIKKLLRQINSDVRRVQAFETAIESSNAAVKAITRGYENGRRTAAEVLAAQRELFRNKKDHTKARYDYILNTLRLKRLTGTLQENDLVLLNTWIENSAQQGETIVERAKNEGKRPKDGPDTLFDALKIWLNEEPVKRK